MESIDQFTFCNGAVRKWLVCLLIISATVAMISPPAFWLAVPGVLLMLSGSVANSYRTDQWMSWQNKGSLNWFESWAVSCGAVLIITPLVLALIRSMLHR
jgi:hypothetical protein